MQTLTMTSLAELTELQLLVPRLSSDHHESVITELAEKLKTAGAVENLASFIDSVLEHDEMASTVFDGVAFPLTRSGNVHKLSFAVGLLSHPIHWYTANAPLVHTVILIAVPDTDESKYLSLVTTFANFLKDKASLAKLRDCTTPNEMLKVLEQIHLSGSSGKVGGLK